jgi:hypothetical protein
MFETLKRKSLAGKVNFIIKMNQEVFEKHNIEPTVVEEPHLISYRENKLIEYTMPYMIMGAFKDHNGVSEILDVKSVTISVHSIMLIANALYRKPEEVMEDVMNNLISSLEDGILHKPIRVPRTHALRKIS